MNHVTTFTDGDTPVVLEQRANGQYRVTYGADVRDNLTYIRAAEEFGYSVFHSLACASKLSDVDEIEY